MRTPRTQPRSTMRSQYCCDLCDSATNRCAQYTLCFLLWLVSRRVAITLRPHCRPSRSDSPRMRNIT